MTRVSIELNYVLQISDKDLADDQVSIDEATQRYVATLVEAEIERRLFAVSAGVSKPCHQFLVTAPNGKLFGCVVMDVTS